MAELRYEAPLATFDLDEWNEFLDFQTTGDEDGTLCGVVQNDNSPLTDGGQRLTGAPTGRGATESRKDGGGSAVDAFDDESFSGSLEDLVNTFDERITKCFKNYNDQVDAFAPVQVRSEDDVIATDSQLVDYFLLLDDDGEFIGVHIVEIKTIRLIEK